MALDSDYVLSPQIQTYFVDLTTGAPLSGGFVYFYQDSNRTNPKDVYELVGSYAGGYSYNNLGNVITLTNVGTFGDESGNDCSIYLYPWLDDGITPDLYFLQVYDANGVFQESRQAWPNTFASGAIEGNDFSYTDNIISNPQFTNFLNPASIRSVGTSITLNLTGVNTTTLIAPDWYFVTNGSGSITYSQIAVGVTNSPSNPSYQLSITASSGFNQNIILQQTLTNTARIFGGDYANAYFEARSSDSSTHLITMSYLDTNGDNYPIATATTPSSNNWVVGQQTTLLPTNTGTAPPAYVYIQISIPVGALIGLTSIQIIGVPELTSSAVFLQKTTARQIDELFHYYKPQLDFKPVQSLLCAWDFTTNPAQFFTTTKTITTTPAYVWDQTIMATSNSTATVTIVPSTQAMLVTTGANSQAFYVLQYLQGLDAVRVTLSNLSVNIQAYTTVNPGVTAFVYLFYGNSSSTIPSLPSSIATLNADGSISSIASNWSLITQSSGYTNTGGIIYNTNASFDLKLGGWLGPNFFARYNVNNFAIMVSFVSPTTGTKVAIDSISLVPGLIPTRPAPQLASDVLKECQYYWEMSYSAFSQVGTATSSNELGYSQNSLSETGLTTAAAYATAFGFQFQTPKRVIPTLTMYDVSVGTSASVYAALYYYKSGGPFAASSSVITVSSYWNINPGTNAFHFVPNTASNLIGVTGTDSTVTFTSAQIAFQYVADARLGIV